MSRFDSFGMFWQEAPRERGERTRTPPPVPETGWAAPAEFPRLEAADQLVIDVETKDLDLLTKGPGWATGNGHIVGLAVGTGDRQWYFPMRHEYGGGNMDADQVMNWAKDELTRASQPKLGANLMYDVGWLQDEGVYVKGKMIDVQFAEPLLDEHKLSYALDVLSKQYLGETKVDEMLYHWCWQAYGGGEGRKQAGNIWRAPIALVGPYAEGDVDLPLRIWDHQRIELEKQGLLDLFHMECELIPLLVEMRMRGVRVDLDQAERTRVELLEAEAKVSTSLDKLTGRKGFNPDVKDDMVAAFDALGLKYNRTGKGNPSFTKQFLEGLHHELPELIIAKRKLAKARGTFVEGYILNQHHNGRIHGQFHPLRSDENGTVSGRFSSCLPNTVNIKTAAGVRPLSKVDRGDYVLTQYNRYRRVIDKVFNGTQNIYRIYLENGNSVVCTSNHRLLTNKGFYSLEDIYEHTHESTIRPHDMPTRCGNIYWGKQAYNSRYRNTVKPSFRCSEFHPAPGIKSRGIPFRKEIEIFSFKDWSIQSYVSEIQRIASQLQRGIVKCRGIFDSLKTRLVPSKVQSCVSSPCRFLSSSRASLLPHRIRNTPHKWRRNRQQIDEPCFSIQCSTRSNSPLYSSIRKVDYVGNARVYDLEIEEDHCFIADGIFVHNSNPNLQNIPARDKEMRRLIRGCFIPEDGEMWFAPDYSQIEYRLMVHAAVGPGSDEARRLFNEDPDMDYHAFTGDLVNDILGIRLDRTPVKNVNFGKIFGMGKATLLSMLNTMTAEQAEEFFNAYDEAIPYAKTTAERASKVAASRGYILTVLKRRARFPFWEPSRWEDRGEVALNKDYIDDNYRGTPVRAHTHKALNCYTQGGAADIIKKAMVQLWQEGYPVPMLQVHDELSFSLDREDPVSGEIIKVMEQAVQLKVPLRVSKSWGNNWGEAK